MAQPPALLGSRFLKVNKRHAGEIFDRVMSRLGGADRLFEEANKSSEAYWKFIGIWQKLQPKEINITEDNSVEALIAADEARKRGEPVDLISEAEDAVFEEVDEGQLWSMDVLSWYY